MAIYKVVKYILGSKSRIQCHPKVVCNYERTLLRNSNLLAFQHKFNRNFKIQSRIFSSQISPPDYKKSGYELHTKTVKRTEILQNAFEKKKEMFIEKKDGIVSDIRKTKTKVKERMEEVIEGENIMTIPNILCVTRAILAPYIGYVIIQNDFSLAMGLLVAAGVTDLMDGFIARNWEGQASKLGSFLDPLADKLLVGSIFICLSYTGYIPIWLTSMVLFRDMFLIVAVFVVRYKNLPPPRTFSKYFDVKRNNVQLAPTFISKVNTAVQLIAVASSLGAPVWNYIDHPALQGLWYLTGATTAAAAISYIISKDTYKIFKKK